MREKLRILRRFIKIAILVLFSSNKAVADGSAIYSYIFGDPISGRIIRQSHADMYTIPASCLKVVTTILAYKILGPDYSFQTALYEADSDIVLKFDGDMKLTSEQLTRLFTVLQNKDIKGRLIIDNSKFIVHPYSTNIISGDRGTHYSKPISAMVIDRNDITIRITPGKVGEVAFLNSDAKYKFNNSIVSSKEPSKISAVWVDDVLELAGNISVDDEYIEKIISPIDIKAFTMSKIEHVLDTMHLNLPIVIVSDKSTLPKNMKLINAINSEPISSIIPPALELSDNMTFDLLFLTIIQQVQGKQVRDWGEGNETIKSLIKNKLGVDVEGAIFADGSGLSYYNRITPRILYNILIKSYNHDIFVSSLPDAAYLNRALDRDVLQHDVRAKTGTLLGFKCLCGYKNSPNTPQAFVTMVHGFMPLNKAVHKDIASFVSDNLSR
jgi:D-alanyl-D-alanine carboxypeptidase/D-alanyl-D-alanine-endopeptidase (penicillin-binding protein 4)